MLLEEFPDDVLRPHLHPRVDAPRPIVLPSIDQEQPQLRPRATGTIGERFHPTWISRGPWLNRAAEQTGPSRDGASEPGPFHHRLIRADGTVRPQHPIRGPNDEQRGRGAREG